MKLSVPSPLRPLLWLLIYEWIRGPVLTWRFFFDGDAPGIDFLGLILEFAFYYNGKLWLTGSFRFAEF